MAGLEGHGFVESAVNLDHVAAVVAFGVVSLLSFVVSARAVEFH